MNIGVTFSNFHWRCLETIDFFPNELKQFFSFGKEDFYRKFLFIGILFFKEIWQIFNIAV